MTVHENTDDARNGKRPSGGAIRVDTQKKGRVSEHRSYLLAEQPPEARIWRMLLGDLPREPFEPRAFVKQGLPLSSVHRLQVALELSEQNVLDIMGISVRTFQRRQREKKPLDPIESDRLYRLAKIEARAIDVFQDEEKAKDWLKRPNRALGDVPLRMLDTEAGTDMVERVLTRIEHGVYS